ncbi:MAG: hypothetical protein JW757_04465, partial [Anaerolineales bacterium]|nr:hypothetical protein [Anaerolineales bacterium]
MTENNELPSEDLPEEELTDSAGQEKFVGKKAEFEETLTDPSIDSPEIPPHPAISLSDMPEEAPGAEEELAEVKEPTQFQLFARRALIWFGVALAFFAAGFAVFYFVLYQPKVAELEDLQTQIVNLEAEIETLEAAKTKLEA